VNKLKETSKRIKYAWWRFLDRIEEAFREEEPQDNPYWFVDQKTWTHIIMNVRSRGSEYYYAEVDLWMNTAIGEASMAEVEFGDEWAKQDIIEAHKIKSLIKMIEVGIGFASLSYLSNELDENTRAMAIELLLKK
jgi:hypothetical protein